MTDHSEYFLALTGERSVRAIASATGMTQSTLNRQLVGANYLPVETVVAICRRYEKPLAPAFVKVGYVTQEEADAFSDRFNLARLSDLDLAREIVARLEAGEAGEALTGPLAVDALEVPDNVHHLPNVGGTRQDLPEAAWGSEIEHTEDDDNYDA